MSNAEQGNIRARRISDPAEIVTIRPIGRHRTSAVPASVDAKKSTRHRTAFAGLFLFTLLLYIRPNEMFPGLFGDFPVVKIIAAIAVLGYLASRLGSRERLTILPVELKMIGVIAILGVIFAPLAANPQDSITILLELFVKVVIIFILMINVIATRERLRSIMSLVVICGAIVAALAIKSYLTGDFTIVQKKDVGVVGLRIMGAVGGIFGNPNDLAVTLDLLLPLAVALALSSKGLKRLAYLACAAVLTGGVIVTFSRGGFLGLLAMSAVLLWKVGRQNRAVTALSFAVFFGVFVLALPSGYTGRISSMFNVGEDPTGSSQARRNLLERAAIVAAHHPIVGIGMGNFHIYSIHEQVAHNSYLEIAAELGLGGLVAYLALILAPIRSLRKIEQDLKDRIPRSRATHADGSRDREVYYLSIALQAVLIAYIVCSFFGSIQYHWFLYYPVAYAVSLRRIHATEQDEPAMASSRLAVGATAAPPPLRGVLWRGYRARGAPASAVNR